MKRSVGGSRPGDDSLGLVKLSPLMERSAGRPEIVVGLIDGPVATAHPDLAEARIREIPGNLAGTCSRASSVACQHGTLVAGMLAARRGSAAPAICPDCTFLIRPIFAETGSWNGEIPSATPDELASAILDCVKAGARVLNLSVALAQPSSAGRRELENALDQAVRQRVLVVAAAGNQGTLGSSVITRHPWVIPVVACDSRGRPIAASNLGHSIGRGGLSAPGEGVTSLAAGGDRTTFGGTSAAAPFVTGTLALLCSEFPTAPPAEIRLAITRSQGRGRSAVVPPLLDAWATFQILSAAHRRT